MSLPSQTLDGLKISSRVTLLEPGMYIFRYASQPPANKPVCIALQQAPLGKGSIDFFPAEGVSKNMLTKLGDTIVARVKGGVTTVLITEYHMFDDVIEPIDLRIDRIDTSPAIMRTFAVVANSEAAATLAAPPAIALELTAHLQQAGEVISEEGWAGTPDSDEFLEGFAINWPNKPAGVDLLYTGTVAGSGPSRNVSTGTFIGARGQGLPLLSAGFSLVGPHRKRYELTGHIVFAGAEPQRLIANQMMHGPTGTEPLVALHIAITPVTKMNAARFKSPWENSAHPQKISAASQSA
ncbi:cell wall-binding repeat 2 family protein [Pseudomonas sp. LRP2-20]|nr:cell wall-binding repeat 2 family protein [Pseudomonas sp. LRP2-20]